MKLHILIPAYNSGSYIKETLDSIRNQHIKSLIVTVIDNNSTDNTLDVVKKYEGLKINIIKNSSNIGALANHNLALAHADKEAEYIKILSSDDVLMPNVLNKQINILDDNLDCILSTCNYVITDANLDPIGKGQYLSGHLNGKFASDVCLTSLKNLIGCPSSVMLRRNGILDLSFNIEFPWMGDLLYYCTILRNGNYINLNEEGFYYRTHPLSDSVLGCPPWIRFSDELRILFIFNYFQLKHLFLLPARLFFGSARYLKSWLLQIIAR